MTTNDSIPTLIQQALAKEPAIYNQLAEEELAQVHVFLTMRIKQHANVLNTKELELLIHDSIQQLKTHLQQQEIAAGQVYLQLHPDYLIQLETFITHFVQQKLKKTERELGLKVMPIKSASSDREEFGVLEKAKTFVAGTKGDIEPIDAKDIFDLNHELTMYEGNACEHLIETLNLLIEELHDHTFIQHKSEAAQQQWQKILATLSLNIRQHLMGMMKAERLEEFQLYQEGLEATIDAIPLHFTHETADELKTSLFLTKLDQAALDFDFSNNVQKENFMRILYEVPEKIHPTPTALIELGNILLNNKLNNDQIEFNNNKTAFLKALREMHLYMSIAEANILAATRIVKKQARSLAEIRSTYLEESPKLNSFEGGWQLAGILIANVALVTALPITLPVLITTGAIGLGIAAAGSAYTFLDLSNTLADPLLKEKLPEMGERDTNKFSAATKHLLGPIQAIELQKKKKQKMRMTAIGIGVSSIGLTLCTVAFGFVLLGAAGAGPLGIGIAAVAIAAISAGILIARHVKEQRRLNKIKETRDAMHQTLITETTMLAKMEEKEKNNASKEYQFSLSPHPTTAPQAQIQAQHTIKAQPAFISDPWIYKENNPIAHNHPQEIKQRLENITQVAKDLGATIEIHDQIARIKMKDAAGHTALIIAHLHKIETNTLNDTTLKACAALVNAMGWKESEVMINDKLDHDTYSKAYENIATDLPTNTLDLIDHPPKPGS